MIHRNTKFLFKTNLLLCLVFFTGHISIGQVYGCKDRLANNYDAAATVNDGSCTYNIVNYTPPVKVDTMNAILNETSGLQMAGNFLWSFNDGGGVAAIYRIDTLTNTILQKVNLAGAVNIDWEDIAFDGIHFYIGDFGNNATGARTNLKIYKFPFSAIPDHISNPVATIQAGQIAIINFSYSDQLQPPQSTGSNNTKFDCEAMIVEDGKLHLFTKNWIDITTTHYVIDGIAAGNYIAMPIETLITNFLVTAADKASGQKIIALLGYDKSMQLNHYMHLLSDYNGGKYFNGNKRQINLPNIFVMGQAEGLCFRTATDGYISNEKVGPIYQKLRSFDITNYVSTTTSTYIFNGAGDWNAPGNWNNSILPPASIGSGCEIVIDPAPGGNCVLNIPYTLSPSARLTIISGKSFIIQGNLTIL